MRTDDSNVDHRRWTNRKLLAEVRRRANLVGFGGNLPEGYVVEHWSTSGDKDSNAIRQATTLYRDSWLNPLLDELERRVLKTR